MGESRFGRIGMYSKSLWLTNIISDRFRDRLRKTVSGGQSSRTRLKRSGMRPLNRVKREVEFARNVFKSGMLSGRLSVNGLLMNLGLMYRGRKGGVVQSPAKPEAPLHSA